MVHENKAVIKRVKDFKNRLNLDTISLQNFMDMDRKGPHMNSHIK